MNAVMSAENQTLQHDNKQLNSLIKEYELTLETLMSACFVQFQSLISSGTFRNRAQDVQERELTLIRDYESKLLAREEENAANELNASIAASESLARMSELLRQVLATTDGDLEREIEVARLEKENEELRRMIGLLPPVRRR